MQRLSYRTETVLSNKIVRHRIVLSFKDSPRKPLRRRLYVSNSTLSLTVEKDWGAFYSQNNASRGGMVREYEGED